MRNILCLILAVAMLALSVAFDLYLGISLTAAFLLFLYCAVKNGHSTREVAGFALQGLKKALIVIKVLLLISLCTALFFASGSTASLIHYALQLIQPKLFLLLCFVIAGGFSMLQGSAFAAASTGGVVLYIIGCAGGVPPAMTVGAILSGVYVGDRASPVSSSLALASSLTDVPHKQAFPLMLKTGLVPFMLALLFYLPFSLANPLSGAMTGLSSELAATYRIGLVSILPVALLLTLCICRVSATWSLLVSGIAAFFVAILYQKAPLAALIPALLSGYSLPAAHPLSGIMQGGGLLPMVKSMYVVAVSCALAVVLEEGGLIGSRIPSWLAKGKTRRSLLLRMWAVSVPGAMLGCNQTMSLVLTGQLMKKPYAAAGHSNATMMTDLSLSATLLSPLIPWTLAFTLPLSALQYSSLACLPFAAFLWIGPVFHAIMCFFRERPGMPVQDQPHMEQ